MTITSGFKTSDGKKVAKLAPPTANINTNGNNLNTIFLSTFPDFKNLIALVNEPNALANLFVPNANDGGIPIAKSAGIDIKPPPPTTASINAAKKPKLIIMKII